MTSPGENFIAIDYETANSSYLSACALGVSVVIEEKVSETFATFVKPPKEFAEFDPFNVMIHGIKPADVKGAPTFDDIWERVESFTSKYELPIACHYSGFDIRVTQALLKYYEKQFSDIRFYDTYTIARKLWPQLINHKLDTLAETFGIELNHHEASSDAEACSKIALKQMKELEKNSLSDVAGNYGYKLGLLTMSGLKTMSDFKNYESQNSGSSNSKSSSKDVSPNMDVNVGSDLYGKNIVFTGALTSMERSQAIQRAVNNGAVVQSGVSKKTDYLIVGVSDFIDFKNGKKTQKLKDAETLSQAGSGISLIDEEDFLRMTI